MGPKYLIGLMYRTGYQTDQLTTASYLSLHKLLVGQQAELRVPSPSVSLPDDNITTLSADSLSDENFNPGLACLGAV